MAQKRDAIPLHPVFFAGMPGHIYSMGNVLNQPAYRPLTRMLEPRRRRSAISTMLHPDEALVLQAIFTWRERRGLETTKSDFFRKCILLAIKADPNEALAIPENSELQTIIDELQGPAPAPASADAPPADPAPADPITWFL